MVRGGQVRVGTSGWIYRHWKGVVYPHPVPKRMDVQSEYVRFHGPTARAYAGRYTTGQLRA